MHARPTTEEALETTIDGCEHTLWCGEVDDVAVALEHVDLLNSLDGLNVQLLERSLELLVVGAGRPVDLLDLSARSTLASVLLSQLEFGDCHGPSWSRALFQSFHREGIGWCGRNNGGVVKLEVIFAYPVHIYVSQSVNL
jgi:hypothetical protein